VPACSPSGTTSPTGHIERTPGPWPPTRELAYRLSVSRTTVTVAYDRLAGEDYDCAGGSGNGPEYVQVRSAFWLPTHSTLTETATAGAATPGKSRWSLRSASRTALVELESNAHGLLTRRADTSRNNPGRLPVGITQCPSLCADFEPAEHPWNGAQMTHNPEGKPGCRAAFGACPRGGSRRGRASPSSRAGAVAARCERRRSH
jgi:hypothetical protein